MPWQRRGRLSLAATHSQAGLAKGLWMGLLGAPALPPPCSMVPPRARLAPLRCLLLSPSACSGASPGLHLLS